MSNNIAAIRQLLINDMARLKAAESAAEKLQNVIDTWSTDKDESDAVETVKQMYAQRQIADEARQSFAARTEMLQHIDLGGVSVDELIISAINAAGADVSESPGDITAGDGRGPDPDADQHVRNVLDTHHR